MNNHKLEIDVSLNGYEVIVSDVTGFGPEGYNEDGLNQNNVNAILLVLEDDLGRVVTKARLDGQDKLDFMSGITKCSLSTSDGDNKPLLKTTIYSVKSYLLTTGDSVTGNANFSDVTGSGFNLLVKDPFVVAEDEMYRVVEVSNANTLLMVDRPLVKFTNYLESGFYFKFEKPVYVNATKILFQLGSLTSNTLQKDGEAPNFAALAGYLQTIALMDDSDPRLYRILRNTAVVAQYLNNKYFRL